MKREDAEAAEAIIMASLTATKAATLHSIYHRIRPGSDGRIRTVLSPVGTETARFSSSDTFLERSTNLQNMPKKAAIGDALLDVRHCIVPRAGYAFVEADYSQIEARITSAYCDDKETLARFASGEDIHRWTASRIFGCTPGAVTSSQRYLGKMARHALNYGMGWMLFQERVNKDADITGVVLTASQARGIVDAYHADNAPLMRWWQSVWDAVQRDRYLVNAFGRRRDFLSPHVRQTDAVAFLPQSTAADLMGWRLSEAYEGSALLRDTMVLQIHDALLCEVALADVPAAKAALAKAMTVPIRVGNAMLTIPVDVKVSRDSWAAMEDA